MHRFTRVPALYSLVVAVCALVLTGCGAPADVGGSDVDAGGAGARAAVSREAAAPVAVAAETVPPGSPGEDYRMLTPDGAWSWLADPRAVWYEGEYRRTYAAWVNSIGDIRVASYDHDTNERTTVTLRPEFHADDHANPTLLVRPDGRIMVFYAMHRGRWLITQTSTNPEDITLWGEEKDAGPFTSEARGHTGPRPVLLPGEENRVMLFWRGPGYDTWLRTSANGWDWDMPEPFMAAGESSPYFHVAGDGDASIHIAVSPVHPRVEGGDRILYARYHDDAVWRADGTRIRGMYELPFTMDECDVVYDGTTDGASAWVWDVADDEGIPVIVYATFPSLDDHRYWYARWTPGGWERHEIAAAGPWFPSGNIGTRQHDRYYAGGITLDHENPSIVYLSRQVGGIFEIERWETGDGGATWESEPVTAGSRANNVRPVVPRISAVSIGTTEPPSTLFWMNGSYVDYGEYSTSIRMQTTGTSP